MGPRSWAVSSRCQQEDQGCQATCPETELRIQQLKGTDRSPTGSIHLLLGNQHPQPGLWGGAGPKRSGFGQGPELLGRTQP